jgi:hypothetical protein
MNRNSPPSRVVYVYGAPAPEKASKKGLSRTRRLVGSALLALCSVVAVIVVTPRQLKMLLPHPARAPVVPVASAPADPVPLPAVRVAWSEIDLDAMPAAVAQDLESGKYYYDNRIPGNFGLAISYWKQALARPEAGDPDNIRQLVASAERELAGQFTRDSGDVIVLLKQRKKDQALVLLDRMRSDFPDITAPQYQWASAMLSKHRR